MKGFKFFSLVLGLVLLSSNAWAMKFFLQVQDRTVLPATIYRFTQDVDTKGCVGLYQTKAPPLEGAKFDGKAFMPLMPMDLTKAYNAFVADQAKLFYLRKWRIMTSWAEKETPKDDGCPPWPGIAV